MAEPTAQEVLLWAMINRARLNPAGEAALYNIDLNEGLAAGTISTASKQPLAFSAALFASADAYSQAMIDRDFFAHNDPQTGSTPQSRGTAAGYQGGVGENIAWRGSTGQINATTTIVTQHQDLFVDAGIDGRGHRTNMLYDAYQEVGIGQVLGAFTVTNQNGTSTTYNASMVTEDFGVPNTTKQFLVGLAFTDSNADGFYSVGEGRGSTSVSIGNVNTATGAAGAYSAAVASGLQTVTFSGGGLATPVSMTVSMSAGRNGLVNLIGTNTVETSVSLTAQTGVLKIIGLGNAPLTLTGNALDNVIVSALGNDTLNGGDGTDTAVFSGNQAAYTLTIGSSGTTIAGPDGTDTLISIEKLQFKDGLVNLNQPAILDSYIFQTGDFNGDHHADLLWFRDNRTVSVWDSANIANAHFVANPGSFPTGWKIVGIGDFDGNGKSDFLWRSDANAVSIWDDGDIAKAHIIAPAGQVPMNWKIVGTGNFDGNTKTDILWQSTQGAISIWNDGSINNANIVVQAGTVPSSWHIVTSTGDFNGNGKNDILWRSDAGAISIWTDGQISQANVVVQAGQVPANWNIVGTGDFDGNGKSDILWQRSDGASVSIWDDGLISRAHIIAQPGQVATTWHIANIGDYDGNGKADIAWRNDDKSVMIWDNGDIATAHVAPNSTTIPDGWHIV